MLRGCSGSGSPLCKAPASHLQWLGNVASIRVICVATIAMKSDLKLENFIRRCCYRGPDGMERSQVPGHEIPILPAGF
jgi:hypothetical protein